MSKLVKFVEEMRVSLMKDVVLWTRGLRYSSSSVASKTTMDSCIILNKILTQVLEEGKATLALPLSLLATKKMIVLA